MSSAATTCAIAAFTAFVLLPLDSRAAVPAERAYDGTPIAAAAGPFPATLPEIQANVFTPSCALSFCHGAAMQAGMSLLDGDSFSNLAGVFSSEVPSAMRVEPFDADSSYIICKLEACTWIVGQQMPLIGGPLQQSVIDVIRDWINMGALEFPNVAVQPTSWGRVKSLYR